MMRFRKKLIKDILNIIRKRYLPHDKSSQKVFALTILFLCDQINMRYFQCIYLSISFAETIRLLHFEENFKRVKNQSIIFSCITMAKF